MFNLAELELLLFCVRSYALSLSNMQVVNQEWRWQRLTAFSELENQLMAEIMEAEQSAALDKVGLYKTGEHYD